MKKLKQNKDEFYPVGELVVQHNKLIEARYRLSLQEKRVVLWLANKIMPNDEEFKSYKLTITEFAKIAQIQPNNLYKEMRSITKKLIQRVLEIRRLDHDDLLQVSWLSSAFYKYKEGYVSLCFSPALKPYMLQLQKEFTALRLPDLMGLGSFSVIRIYELLKQYESIGERNIKIEELRKNCGIEEKEYPLFGNFKQRVLKIAQREINSKTDINIEYEEIKESRKVVAIKFIIKKNPNYGKTEFEKDQAEKSSLVEKELRSANALTEGIMEFGFSRVAAKRFLQRDSEETVRNALKSVNLQIERGHVKNAKAMFVVAVNEKWNPEIFVAKKPKKAK